LIPQILQLLALELLKILLENSGPVFRHSDRFMAAIKQYLCLSLLKNVTSNVTQAQALTCSIFFTLLVKFRQVMCLSAASPPSPVYMNRVHFSASSPHLSILLGSSAPPPPPPLPGLQKAEKGRFLSKRSCMWTVRPSMRCLMCPSPTLL